MCENLNVLKQYCTYVDIVTLLNRWTVTGNFYMQWVAMVSWYIYVKCKVRIRTILGFCCANQGSKLCAIILGSRMQTSDPRICCTNLGSTHNHLGSRNQISAICGLRVYITIYLLIIGNHHCLQTTEPECVRDCTIDCASLLRMVELLCVCDRSWLL